MVDKQESQDEEEIIIPSFMERLLLNESERAQRACKLYIATLDKKINKLKDELDQLVAEKNSLINEGNQNYDQAVKAILKEYKLEEAEIDFNVPDGPVIKILKKVESKKSKA